MTGFPKKIGVMAYKTAPEILEAAAIISNWSKKIKEVEFLFHESIAPRNNDLIRSANEDVIINESQIIMSLGGDGTFLSVARMVGEREIPILGVNLGRLGFLAEVDLIDLEKTLQNILSNNFVISERMLIKIKVFENSKLIFEDTALNDVVFTGKTGLDLIDLYVESKDEYLTNYWVDGLLVSTPTGSTAYSLSAGGPVIYPRSECFLLTPLNPKSLAIRPIVLPASRSIKVVSKNEPGKFVKMVSDGRRDLHIKPDHVIEITKHEKSIKVVRPPGVSFLKAIRRKLGWSGSHGIEGFNDTRNTD